MYLENMHLSSLPEELIAEVFNKLPAKSLIRCTSVCKSWLFLITDPKFISANLKSNINNPALLVLAFRNDSARVAKSSHACLQLDNEKLGKFKLLFFPFFSDHPTFNVAGCCNGVVCLFDVTLYHGYKCILWNPSIGKYVRLPEPTLPIVINPCIKDTDDVYGFWYDSIIENFKVVRIVNTYLNNNPFWGCEVYSLNSRTWKIIIVGNNINIVHGMRLLCVHKNDGSNFVKSSLHWPAIIDSSKEGSSTASTGSILVFNVVCEKFSVIELPECLKALNVWDEGILHVRVYNESTIMAFNYSFWVQSNICDIWVMKEYGVLESWMKLCTIDKTKIRPSKILMFRKSGELLVRLHTKDIVSHNLVTQQNNYLIRRSQDFYGNFGHSYVWSLYLLHDGKDVYSYKQSLESNLHDGEDHCKVYKYNETIKDEEIINSLSHINAK